MKFVMCIFFSLSSCLMTCFATYVHSFTSILFLVKKEEGARGMEMFVIIVIILLCMYNLFA